jgi:DNA repair photolyase
MAERFGTVPAGGWDDEQIDQKAVEKSYGKRKGIIMFPTAHDISPLTVHACLRVLKKMLASGNRVLVVSKPRLECISLLTNKLDQWKSQMMFRFTIGSDDDSILSYWEPNAPGFEERLGSLIRARERGYRTSVSMEPLLDARNVVRIFDRISPWVSDSIWIGKMNKVRQRVKIETEWDEESVNIIEENQTDDCVRKIYAALKDRPQVRWKESFREVLGIEAGREEWS